MARGTFPDLVPGERPIQSNDELLHRACPMVHFDSDTGIPDALMFRVGKADGGKLSVSRSSLCDQQTLFEHRSTLVGRSVAGVWSISVGDAHAEDLRAVDDSRILDDSAPPGHAYLDHRLEPPLTSDEREALRARLLMRALARPSYRPSI